MVHKRIQMYDSLHDEQKFHRIWMEYLQYYLELEYEKNYKTKKRFTSNDFWTEFMKNIPKQTNSHDCGVFICAYADFCCRGLQIEIKDVPTIRNKMKWQIMSGQLDSPITSVQQPNPASNEPRELHSSSSSVDAEVSPPPPSVNRVQNAPSIQSPPVPTLPQLIANGKLIFIFRKIFLVSFLPIVYFLR